MTTSTDNLEQLSIERAKQWANNTHFDESSRNEIQNLIDINDTKEIKERFYKSLSFGTGGMRAILGQGINRLNKYNIRKASHALCQIILKSTTGPQKVAISYDSRNFSFEFAKNAAEVFAANGITALIYKRLNPVALCSFAIRHHGCAAGVMVTASHNPPEYNGYKVFWSDGAQVTPPHDEMIIHAFNNITNYGDIPFMDFSKGEAEGLIQWLDEKTERAYFDAIKSKSLRLEENLKYGKDLKIVYTALHGSGFTPCSIALSDLGFTNILSVKEQEKPDGSFPTVSSPNPENAEALALGVELMRKENADLCMGTDPDTDRVGVAIIHEGEVVYLNGNQIGLLMLHYILTSHKEKGSMPENPYFVKTIVTTELQATVAKAFNVTVENTLTGFKWICGKVFEIEKSNPERNFLFATEESFGYLNHGYVRDKDGVSSIALLSEIALYHKRRGHNFITALDEIYEEYGFAHETLLSKNYLGLEGSQKIDRIMNYFRTFFEDTINDQKIEKLADYESLVLKDWKTEKTEKIDMVSSNVLGFHFAGGNKLFLRPSGTEPKIKFYIMIQTNEGTLPEKKRKAMSITKEIIDWIEGKIESI